MSQQKSFQVKLCPDSIWDQFLQNDNTATFFQMRNWFSITGLHLNLQPSALLFTSGRESAVLPLLKKKKLFEFFTGPFGTYTGLLASHKLSSEFMNNIEVYLNTKNIRFLQSPFSKNPLKLHQQAPQNTFTISLASLNAKKIYQYWKKGHRDNLKNAQRQNLTVKQATSQDDVKTHFSLYVSTTERWQKKHNNFFSEQLFWNLVRQGFSNGSSRLWMCEFEGKLIASVLVFYCHTHLVAWNGAADKNYFRLYANQFIYHAILQHAKEHQMGVFDFNPSQDLPGVIRFKKGFGAVEKPAFINQHYNLPYKIMSKIRGG